jgi:hypothetical protein
MEYTVKKQFVIQQHTTANGVHWDLMLETDGTLWTWRLNTPPAEIKNKPIDAERIADHPIRFLTYEGPVQSGTGRVTIADKGTYTLCEQTDNILLFELHGKILSGNCSLSKASDATLWTFQFQSELQ